MSNDLIQLSKDVGAITAVVESIEKNLSDLKVQTYRNVDQLIVQNRILDEHILGVKTQALRLDEERESRIAFCEEVRTRLDYLETGPKFRKNLIQLIFQISAVIASSSIIIATAAKLLNLGN